MFSILGSHRYAKALKRLQRSGKLTAGIRKDLEDVFDMLAREERLPAAFEDHQLQGEFKKYRECHIRGDLLLMYEKRDAQQLVIIVDIGSHSQLFG